MLHDGDGGGGKKKIITNISVRMNHGFVQLMQLLQTEANNGNFRTKGDAVRRRDELLQATENEPASREPNDTVPDGGEHFEDAQVPDID